MPSFALILIVYREFVINFVRLVAAQKGVAIGARRGGKIKTITYIVTCYYMLVLECGKRLFGIALPSFTSIVSTALAVLCVILAYISLTDYLLAFKDVVFPQNNKTKPKS
jgi:CDP-diacylglycerol--glycerol-3-phosphate 3-phosphatidyltransferase